MPVAIIPTWWNIYFIALSLKIASPESRSISTSTAWCQSHCVAMKPLLKIHLIFTFAVTLVFVPEAIEPIFICHVFAFCIRVASHIRSINISTVFSCCMCLLMLYWRVCLMIALQPSIKINLNWPWFYVDAFATYIRPITVKPCWFSETVTDTSLVTCIELTICVVAINLPTFNAF